MSQGFSQETPPRPLQPLREVSGYRLDYGVTETERFTLTPHTVPLSEADPVAVVPPNVKS
jgi:hypothetical protein